uniref:RNase H type-1 domain-containing protein n=1 Tax=Quercus lobata TaxID=97700 RepID=A0A7N2MFT9_QUELO
MAISWNIWNNSNVIRQGEKLKTVATLIIEATRVAVDYQSVQDYPIPAANLLPTRWTPSITGQVVRALSQQIYAPLGSLEVDAKAMEAAVIFARDIGIQDVIFEGNSLQVCSAMNGCSLTPDVDANVLECIFLHLQFFRSFLFFSH